MRIRHWVLLLSALALVGCGSATTQPTNAPTPDEPAAAVDEAVESDITREPTGLRIPSIGVNSSDPWVPLGIQGFHDLPVTTKANEIETPDVKHPKQLGWFCPAKTKKDPFPADCGAPEPGRVGAAVVLAHVDGNGQVGLFKKLGQVKKGDLIEIDRADGLTAVFLATEIETVLKTSFPREKVYSDVDKPVLRLVSCGGQLDRARHRYLSNIIVYADLVSLKPTAQ